jgi:hypothetical protein
MTAMKTITSSAGKKVSEGQQSRESPSDCNPTTIEQEKDSNSQKAHCRVVEKRRPSHTTEREQKEIYRRETALILSLARNAYRPIKHE